jgi:hypothetical protein
MRLYHRALLAAAFVTTSAPVAHGIDLSGVTCHQFLASGTYNMAPMMMFLRGYHAGKTGVIPYDSHDSYAGRLGVYCRQHPAANLVESSERILVELDHGL